MSLLWTLRKWIDPVEWLREEEDKRRAREGQPVDPNSGGTKIDVGDLPARPIPDYRCRLCGYESASDAFCPQCVAMTMEPKRP